jgi:hypothetical protein
VARLRSPHNCAMPMVEERGPHNRDEKMRQCCFDYGLPLQCLSPHTTHWWQITDTLFFRTVRIILVFQCSLRLSFTGTSLCRIVCTTWMGVSMATNAANGFREMFEVIRTLGHVSECEASCTIFHAGKYRPLLGLCSVLSIMLKVARNN